MRVKFLENHVIAGELHRKGAEIELPVAVPVTAWMEVIARPVHEPRGQMHVRLSQPHVIGDRRYDAGEVVALPPGFKVTPHMVGLDRQARAAVDRVRQLRLRPPQATVWQWTSGGLKPVMSRLPGVVERFQMRHPRDYVS